jgi:hypothetical protein
MQDHLISAIYWYASLSIGERAALLLIIMAYLVVMTGSFLDLLGRGWGWYRGIQSTPLFQILMWLGALPLILPFFLFVYLRCRALGKVQFIGNYYSHIYHHRECEYQKRISSFFSRCPLTSAAEAQSRGFRPCNWCRPH